MRGAASYMAKEPHSSLASKTVWVRLARAAICKRANAGVTTLIDSRIRIVRQAAVSGFHNRGRRSVDVWQALCWLARMSTGPSWVAAMSGIAGRSSSTALPEPRIEGLGCRNRPQSGSSASAAALKASSSPGLRILRSTMSSLLPASSRRTIGGIRQYSNAVVSQIVISMPQECTKHQAELPQILGDSFMYPTDVTQHTRVHAGKTPSWLLAAQKKTYVCVLISA